MRRINLVFLAVLVIAATVLGGGIHLVHGFQMRRNASALLDRARRAESTADLATAEVSLRWYLNSRPEDGAAWVWYARVVDRRITDRRQWERDFLVHEEALRHNPGDAKLVRRCADLAFELRRYPDAHRHLSVLLTTGQSTGAAVAELEDLVGQCASEMTQYELAEQRFVQAIKHDPGRVSCYDRLARLRRTELRHIEAADDTINEMVAKNPNAGLAYIERWRYFRDFTRSANNRDIQKGLELAPNDPEVLLTAGMASEEKLDAAAARAYFEKGSKLDPKNVALALGLARLETREGHLDRAEKVLRKAWNAYPSAVLAFVLAETLILENKIDGKDQAKEFIARLRNVALGDNYVRCLEAEIPFQRRKWAEAIAKIQMALAVLGADRQLTAQLNLMLAECYGRLGDEEQRLDALRRVAEDGGAESARIELFRALARSGKLDQAVITLLPLAVSKPEWRLDLVRLLLQKAIRQPRNRRNWQIVERHLREAEQALPHSVESLALLRLDVLAAQGRLDDARSFLSAIQAKDPRNLSYRLTLARLTQRQGKSAAALKILDQTEKELGSSVDLVLARLDYWGLEGGATAKAAVARLAEARQQVPAANLPAFLDRLGSAEIRLGDLGLGRQYWRELAALQPDNRDVRLGLLDLAFRIGDHDDATALVDQVRKAEGDEGTTWRFARATLLVEGARRGDSRKLAEARKLASEIADRRPKWASGIALNGEIAELSGSSDQAIDYYLRAVELGNVQPSLVRRLAGLLNERNRFAEIDQLARVVRDQGAALDEITIVKALDAMRKHDFDNGLTLARQVFPETSNSPSDHLTLGRLYLTAGQSEHAGKEFRRAIELGPGVPDTWLTYVQFLVQARQIDQARAVVEAARKALPADRANLTLAQCFLVLGDAKQADELISRVVGDEGESAGPEALRIAAIVSLNGNRLDKVEKFLNKLDTIANLPASERAWAKRTRATVLLSRGRPVDRDRALRLVEQNLLDDPDSADDRQLRAAILALQPGRRGEAIKMLEEIAGADRLGAKERFLLAQLYLNQRDEEKYKGEMQKLLDVKPANAWHLAHFIDFWIGRNQLDQAARWLAELKRTEPNGLIALEREARLLDLRRRKSELLALLHTRGREMPDQIGPIAGLLDRYGFAKQAESAYRAFVDGDSARPERVLALAQFLARQDRIAEAMEIFKQAWLTCRHEQVATAALLVFDAPSAGEAERRQVEAWVAEAVRKQPGATLLASKLGVIRIRQAQYVEAEKLFRALVASNPDNVDALNNLAWLLAFRDQTKTTEALGLIDRAMLIQGPTPSLFDTRAVVLLRAGRFDQALKELSNAKAGNARNPSFALHLAWAYQAIGQSDRARTQLQEAEKLGLKPHALDPLESAVFRRLSKELSSGDHHS